MHILLHLDFVLFILPFHTPDKINYVRFLLSTYMGVQQMCPLAGFQNGRNYVWRDSSRKVNMTTPKRNTCFSNPQKHPMKVVSTCSNFMCAMFPVGFPCSLMCLNFYYISMFTADNFLFRLIYFYQEDIHIQNMSTCNTSRRQTNKKQRPD